MIMLSENIRTGLASVRKSRFRSFFTMLGIIIGVVSVVTIVSLGEGVKQQISGQIDDLGTNLLTVRPGKLVERDNTGEISSVNLLASSGVASLTDKDVDSVRTVPNVESAAALSTMSAVPKYESKDYPDAVVLATSPDFGQVIDHPVEFGTFLSTDSLTSPDVVIGPAVASNLFNETVPVGKSLEIRGKLFRVTGIFEPFKEVPLTSGIDYNNAVFMTEENAADLTGTTLPVYEILVKAKDGVSLEQTRTEIHKLLLANHAGQEDFTVLRQDEVTAASDQLLELLTQMIFGMAAVTLFIGGIGIMNVMLVSVTERTREIGIRKAIGATNRQIRSQFMMEAFILSVWGVALGVIISGAVNIILRIFTDLQPVLMWQPIAVASAIAILVGVVFGVVPAVVASRKDPIDALRPY